ncbi:MAG TPA: hypothetical protein VHJ38_09075 [Nitrososphaeraceae archaeon]|jgi:hypothetical protein|nr:hypothetical protein [Nitrososphaeraceae archaeon]
MNEEKNSKKEKEAVKDDIIQDYDTVLKESGVLTSISGIIFGFLLNISINSPKGFTIEDSIILMMSLYSISFAVSFFVMPIIYHHIQYPYRDLEKFKIRSHQFIKFGMIPGAITMYLGLLLGLKFSLHTGIGPAYEYFSYILAIGPLVLVYIFFKKRK